MFVILAIINYVENNKKGDNTIIYEKSEKIKMLYDYYDDKKDEKTGLIKQPPFSDWQDSVNRGGFTFLTNLIYYKISKYLLPYAKEYNIDSSFVIRLKREINKNFYDDKKKMYRSILDKDYYSLESNLLAIDWNFVEEGTQKRKDIYESLRDSELWKKSKSTYPGRSTFPKYPSSQKALHVKLVCLEGYHDNVIWTWITALSAKISCKMDDKEEYERIINLLHKLYMRDGTICETYFQDKYMKPFESFIYKTEEDFSWSAGKYIEMINEINLKNDKHLNKTSRLTSNKLTKNTNYLML